MSKRLYVGNLADSVTDAQLAEYFAKAGTVVSARVITDKNTGQGKGFGFVEMTTEEEAQKAITELNGTTLGDKAIVVNEARPQGQPAPAGN